MGEIYLEILNSFFGSFKSTSIYKLMQALLPVLTATVDLSLLYILSRFRSKFRNYLF